MAIANDEWAAGRAADKRLPLYAWRAHDRVEIALRADFVFTTPTETLILKFLQSYQNTWHEQPKCE